MFVLEKQESTFHNLPFESIDFLFGLANRHDRVYLTLDCSGINKGGPQRFRKVADKPDFQTCHFNHASDEQAYNEFISKRINEIESNDRIQFKIIHLKIKRQIEKRNLMVQKNFAL